MPSERIPLIILWLLSLTTFTTATAAATGPFQVHNITRGNNLKFENLAFRFDGQALVTISAPSALLYLVDPLLIRPPTLINAFTDIEHVAGIYELSPDIFYVSGGNWTITNPTFRSPQSLALYEVDMREFFAWPNGTIAKHAAIRKVVSIPDGALLNGVTSFRGQSEYVFIADTFQGLIWRTNVLKSDSEVILKDNTTAGTSSNPAGINGIKTFNNSIYYTNTGQSALYKVPFNAAGYVTGKPSMIASGLPCDDLVLDRTGNAYVAGPANVITKVTPSGEKSVVAGTYNSPGSTLVGSTAVAFGRSATDWTSLYVTTNGGATQVVNGSQGVSRIDVFDLPARGAL